MAFLDDKHNLKVFTGIIIDLFKNSFEKANTIPTFILFGGQPGAGKSAVIEIIQSAMITSRFLMGMIIGKNTQTTKK